MIAVDTNVLIRILVDDPGATDQMKVARELMANSSEVFVPQIVQVETVWVLESAYCLDKAAICKILEHLLSHPLFHLQSTECFQSAVTLYRQHSADFSDCLILTEASQRDLSLFTFDKKLGRLEGTKWLTTESQ